MVGSASAQLSVTSVTTPFLINFDGAQTGVSSSNFTAPATLSSQLNAGAFTFSGVTTGSGLAAMNATVAAGTPRLYAFQSVAGNLGSGVSLGGQADNGNRPNFLVFTLAVSNNTGQTVTGFNLGLIFDWFNAGNRLSTLNVGYSTAGVGGPFTAIPSLTATSTASSTSGTALTSTVTGLNIPNNGQIVYQFSFSTAAGAGNIESHIAVDDISVTLVPEPGTYLAGALALGACLTAWRRRKA